MLTEISVNFGSKTAAKRALTYLRKYRRVALRGAVPCERHTPEGGPVYRLFVPLGGTGFSAPEMRMAVLEVCGLLEL